MSGLLDVDRRVTVLSLARMADAFGNSFLIVVLPIYIAESFASGGPLFATEALVTGVVLSAFGFVNSFFQPFTGRLSDRLGKRKVFVLVGLAILAVANSSYPLADSFHAIFTIRALQGLGAAFTIPAAIALVNLFASTHTRGSNMGVYNTFRLVGFGLGPTVAGIIASGGPYPIFSFSLTGLDLAFYIAGASALLSLSLVALLVQDPEDDDAEVAKDLSVSVLSEDDGELLDPIFTLGLATFFMAVGIALLSTIEVQVNAHLNQGPDMFGIEFGAYVVALIAMQTPVGKASDKFGRKPFVVAGMLLLLPATLAQGLVVTPLEMVAARFVQGLAAGMVFAPALALAGDLSKRSRSGSTLSILTMAFGLGTAVGPLSSGFLIRYGYVVPFAYGAVLAGIGALLVHTQVEETLKDVPQLLPKIG